MAQYTDDGYYRIRNFGTKRYMYLTDNTGSYDMDRDVGDFAAIQMWKGEERPISDPATLMYVVKKGAEQFDLTSQGTGIYAMVHRYVDVHTINTPPFQGTYTVSATAYGITKFLSDNERSNVDEGAVGTGESSPYRNWEVFKVTPTNDNSYFGITPNVQLGDKYYYPFYISFPFTLYSSGMKAYTISRVGHGCAVLSQVNGMIPAYTPVYIECASANPSDNRLDLKVSSASPLANNLLQGVLFCNNKRPKSKDAIKAFDAQTMRVLGVTSEGKLGFVSNSPNLATFSGVQYLPANQAYLSVPAGTEEELTIVTEEEYNEILSNITFTLTYLVDGREYQTQTLKPGASITPLAALTREGYTFSGWSEIPEVMPEEDVTIEGSFTPNKYTLTYMLGEEVYKTLSIDCGSRIPQVKTPTREGHTFDGWTGLPDTMPPYNMTVNGTFSINSYALTYVLDGEVYQTTSVEYGSPLSPISVQQREGYTFSGWSEMPATMPASDLTITGTFNANSYTLSYYVDGQLYRTLSLLYGAAIEPLANPVQEGYTFSGWADVPTSMPARNVTVEGSFSVNSYTLSYLVDGVSYESQTLPYGTVIEPLAYPEKEGHTFSGWNQLPETMPASDVTVAGTFTIREYNLTYVLNGASYDNTTYRTVTYKFGATITPLTGVPSLTGYNFQGWENLPETMPSSDLTIVGNYQAKEYILSYVIAGETYQTLTVPFGTAIEPLADPEKEGYTFSGWSGLPATMPSRNVTVQGSFSINSYTLTLILDGGTYDNYVYRTSTYQYGASITIYGILPQQKGYNFAGWDNLPSTMPAHDVVVIGRYIDATDVHEVREAEQQRIVYDLSGHRIMSENLPKGIYIINGKKTLVK